jgi:SAM-dependent MidA family methyltransferase
MCHRAHRADDDPLVEVGLKDITAHVNFTGIALAAQEQPLPAGQEWQVLGYTTQAHFLINCGIAQAMERAPVPERAMVGKLLMEHEMGELFQVLLLAKGAPWDAVGFAHGDRTHRL